jgi:hypothetical protein
MTPTRSKHRFAPLSAAAAVVISIAALGLWRALSPPQLLHEFEKVHLTPEFVAEGASSADIDGDGMRDIASGPYWYPGPGFDVRHEIHSPKSYSLKGFSDNFLSWLHDLDADGYPDYVVVGYPGEASWWYRNPGGAPGHWKRHLILPATGSESPGFADITGDGRPELICSTGGRFGYASFDRANPAGPWRWHPITDRIADDDFSHGLGVGDVNGDGRQDLLLKDGWAEQPESLAGDPVWEQHPADFGEGGAQIYAYDVDGDGDNDVVTSLHAHAYGLSWFEQTSDARFVEHRIIGRSPGDNRFGVTFTQMHALAVADIDGDGLDDIVTGKRHWAHNGRDPEGNAPAVLYWFELTRTGTGAEGVEFIPHQIDGDSGVGTQVVAADLSGNGLLDILVGNKRGTFIHRHTTRRVGEREFLEAQPRPR